MSLLCSIESCEQPPSVFCHTCNKNYCNEHLNEHDDQLNTELHSLTDRIKSLSHRYVALDTNKFIVITYKRLVCLINEYPLSFTRVISIPQDKWWSCTCSKKSLLLTTYGIDGSIFEFNILFSFKLIKQWKSPYTCKQHERIHDINYENETLALAISGPLTNNARIELRSSSTLTRLWSLSLDIDELLYQPSIHCSPLKFNEWIVTIENTSSLFHISKDGQLKSVHTFKHFVRNAIYFASNMLAIRTENNHFFHKI